MDDADAVRVQVHAPRHQVGKVTAGCDEEIDVARSFGHHLPGLGALGRRQRVEKCVFALQHADDGHAKFRFQPPRHPDEQDVGKRNEIAAMMHLEPRHQFVHFARLVALFAAQHGDGQFTHILGAGATR